MIQAFRNLLTRKTPASGLAALLLLSVVSTNAHAVAVLISKTDTLNQDQTTSPFFNATSGQPSVGASGGWTPKADPGAAKAGEITSTTPTRNFTFVGTSTAPDWTNGNGIPAGVSLSFTVEFTLTALPTGSYLTAPGPITGLFGRGLGITQTLGGSDDIDKPDGFQVSPATISNINFTGTPSDTTYTFTPGTVGNFGTRVFRTNNFDESVAGMLLTQGTETLGFGVMTGTAGSNLLINNNFGTPGGSEAGSSIFDRKVGPYTLVVDGPDAATNVSVIKGIGVIYDINYDMTLKPVSVAGDYNHNGVVDGADYVLWRKGDLAADSNGDTLVDQADYDAWRANFGNGSTPGLGVASAVPEPTSAMLLILGLIAAPIFAVSRRVR